MVYNYSLTEGQVCTLFFKALELKKAKKKNYIKLRLKIELSVFS